MEKKGKEKEKEKRKKGKRKEKGKKGKKKIKRRNLLFSNSDNNTFPSCLG